MRAFLGVDDLSAGGNVADRHAVDRVGDEAEVVCEFQLL
jgi:hypothetical protein